MLEYVSLNCLWHGQKTASETNSSSCWFGYPCAWKRGNLDKKSQVHAQEVMVSVPHSLGLPFSMQMSYRSIKLLVSILDSPNLFFLHTLRNVL